MPITHCSQFYPYAAKDTIPCSGDVHRFTIRRRIHREPPMFDTSTLMDVCDAHTPSFRTLMERPGYFHEIMGDEVIGEIAPQTIEGKPPTKEQE